VDDILLTGTDRRLLEHFNAPRGSVATPLDQPLVEAPELLNEQNALQYGIPRYSGSPYVPDDLYPA
jgi:hypothetical protein